MSKPENDIYLTKHSFGWFVGLSVTILITVLSVHFSMITSKLDKSEFDILRIKVERMSEGVNKIDQKMSRVETLLNLIVDNRIKEK